MKVALLAAGVGARLRPGPGCAAQGPAALRRRESARRNLDILVSFGLCDITVVVGHRAAEFERELAAPGAADLVRTRFNPDYRASSLLSLWTLREVFAAGEPVLYMDADVIYDRRLLARLIESPHDDCLLIDRAAEPSEECLKVCICDGFARFGPASAARLVAAIRPTSRAGAPR